MLKFWVRSISLGLLAAIAIIMVTPSLRAKLMPVVEQPRNIGALQISFNEAVRKAAPAVVNIYNRKYSENDRRKLSIQGLGSGVIVSEKGYIITNYHVVAQADQIVVALQDGRAAAAQLVGKDRRTDIAVLRVEGTGLPVIPLNPDYHPKVGDVVLAIGNPYNLGQTTTFGIISLPDVHPSALMVAKPLFKLMPQSMTATQVVHWSIPKVNWSASIPPLFNKPPISKLTGFRLRFPTLWPVKL